MKRELASALKYALNKGVQIHPDAFKILEGIDVKKIEKIIKDIVREKTSKRSFQIGQDDLESYLGIKEDISLDADVRVLVDPTGKTTTGEGIDGFGKLFVSRFNKLKQIISERPESKMLRMISNVKNIKTKDDIYVCGLVTEQVVNQNSIRMVIEDSTGSFEGNVYDIDLQKVADKLLLDQFVMLRIGVTKSGIFAVKDIILPDVPDRSINHTKDDVFAVFLSDLHIGSRYFMEDEFIEFIEWISSPDPVARKIRFVLICGDLVDGVGIYPNQNKELVYDTIEKQLARTEELLARIPTNVKIIIMPGNHDPGRRALPQPAIPEKYNQSLWDRENVIMVGNPSMVSLNGVKIMLFHGQSIDDIVKTTPGLSYNKPANVMKYLLKARHLSPIFGSQTPIAPESEDHLVIEQVPDIFHVGHVHRAEIDKYKGILLVNSGSWQLQTPFQSSVGMIPNPGIAIMVNLKTFQVLHQNYNSDLNNVL